MIVERIKELFDLRGDSEYGGEAVTQLEHALQAAELAEKENASTELIVAALLHDVGHLLHELPDNAPDEGVDDHHENSASHFLKDYFPESVVAPVRMHVDAKRYLCATDPSYFDQLSPPSVTSLKLQGGPMTAEEVKEFASRPYAEDAARLRRWDDLAKDADHQAPNLDHYLPMIKQVCLAE